MRQINLSHLTDRKLQNKLVWLIIIINSMNFE